MKAETNKISEQLFKELIQFLGLISDNVKFIGYSQNFTYELSGKNANQMLRITSDSHRLKNQIIAELQWINILKSGGVHACGAIEVNGNKAIQSFETPSDTLHCVIFEKAKGLPINSEMFNNDLYYLHGALVGKSHRLARNCPIEISINRFNWENNRLFTTDINKYLPENAQESINEVAKRLIGEALKIEQTNKTYGMIHFDLHYDNYFRNGNELHLFDFDNCSNGYFISDISKAIWSSVFTYHRKHQFNGKSPFANIPEVSQIMESLWEPFWNGYRSENEVEKTWFEEMPLFFELIHLKEFVHHYRHGVPNRNDELRGIFAMEQKQIEQREIPVSFDFIKGKAVAIKKARA
jgi:Ser/Thr protein kinase RdoA (MazF antagonist)